MIVCDWSHLSEMPLCEEAVRRLFCFDEGYRFYRHNYESRTQFPAAIRRNVRIYVFDGHCAYKQAEQRIDIKAGQYVDMPPGDYEFETLESSVKLMKVYLIPELGIRSSP